MFYVKEPLKDGVDVTVEINDENVFCRCPVCGREVPVNLKDVLSDSDHAVPSTPPHIHRTILPFPPGQRHCLTGHPSD